MPVEITEVSYGKTIPLRQYENVRIDLKAKVKPGQSWRQVLETLRVHVAREEQRELAKLENG